MAETFAFSVSQQNARFYFNDVTLNNATQFYGNYSGYSFIKPVAFVYKVGSSWFGSTASWKNGVTNSNVCYYSSSNVLKDNTETKFYLSSSYPTNFNFGTTIPVFKTIESASNYSMGLPYNEGDWIGGADVRPPAYNWQSVPSISGKNGILSLVTLDSESINDGEPVSGAAVSVFDQNPVSGNNVKDIVDGNTPLIPSAVDVTAAFIISNPPVGELASRILAAKKGSIPESIEDADKTISIPANASNVTMPGLDENSQYYFAIFVADATGDTAVSDPKDIYTSADEGWSFDYTGEIQTFVAPKTGIYSLETWGAQGGDATDGTNSARGGYGAYAVGEAFLTQGETLYINVGGQNGYGGGGNYSSERIVGTWIDGKDVYEDTFEIANVVSSTDTVVTENLGATLLVDYECSIAYTSGECGTQNSIAGTSEGNYPRVKVNTSGELVYYNKNGVNISKFYVTARYLKE